MKPISRALLGALLIASVLAAPACTSSKPASAIQKVQPFHLKSDRPPDRANPMMISEYNEIMHGAITPTERRARVGNYYTVKWSGRGLTGPVTLRLEYRQAEKGSQLRTQEVVIANPQGKNTTRFQVTGPAYRQDGRVIAWRIVVLDNGVPVAVETSALWE